MRKAASDCCCRSSACFALRNVHQDVDTAGDVAGGVPHKRGIGDEPSARAVRPFGNGFDSVLRLAGTEGDRHGAFVVGKKGTVRAIEAMRHAPAVFFGLGASPGESGSRLVVERDSAFGIGRVHGDGQRVEQLTITLLTLAQRFLHVAAICDIARTAADGDYFAMGAEDRKEDVVVDAAAVGTGEGNIAPHWFAGCDHLVNLAIVQGGVPGLVTELQAIFSDGLFPGASPHREQGVVGVGEAVVEIEDVTEVGRVGQHCFVKLPPLRRFRW